MRIRVVVIFVITIVAFNTASYSQDSKITLDMQNVTVKEVIKAIESQSDFLFFYQDQHLDLSRRVSVKITNGNLDDLLNHLFEGTDNIYVISDRQIVIGKADMHESEKIIPFLERQTEPTVVQPQERTVTGKVTDVYDIPLPGVSVIAKGSTIGTVTNDNGEFSLIIPLTLNILQFSFVGKKIQEEDVTGTNIIFVKMGDETIELDEVIAVGYSTIKKINITGAIDVVYNDQLQNRQSPTVSQLLLGLVPSMNVSIDGNGFQPGAIFSMTIRGMGSINGGGPYVVIDGFPGDLNRLNPDEIESISILKDAAASAIYGARAPYGVILITTKSGRKHTNMVVNYNGSISVNTPQRLPDMLDSYTHARVINEASKNYNPAAGYLFSEDIVDCIIAYQNENWNFIRQKLNLSDDIDPKYGTWPRDDRWHSVNMSYANNDWYGIHYGHSINHKHNLSLSGGSDRTAYYFSFGYIKQEGVLNFGDDTYQRGNISAKIDTEINNWWDFKYETRFMKSRRYYPNYGNVFSSESYNIFFHFVSRLFPSAPLYNGFGTEYDANSLITLRTDAGNNEINITETWQSVSTEIRPVKEWKFIGNFGYQSVSHANKSIQNIVYYESTNRTVLPVPFGPKNSVYQAENVNDYYWSLNFLTSFEKDLNKKHYFYLLTGTQLEYANYNSLMAYKNTLLSHSVPSLSTAIGDPVIDESLAHWATQGYFGRFMYNFREKYLFESNIRYDGTSKFRLGKRWGLFPSFSAGWIMSNENFWIPILPYINHFKIRASWGSLGNQTGIGQYQDIALMPINPVPINWLFDFGSARPIGYTGSPALVSQGLKWETATTKNIGANIGLFNYKLQLDIDWYERLTTDMIGPSETLPGVIGTIVPRTNNAELRTRGWEVVLDWKQRVLSDFSYYCKLNLYNNQSVITKYNNPTKNLSDWYEGKKAGEIWGFVSNGLFKTQEEIDSYLKDVDLSFFSVNWRPGDVKYEDLDNSGAVNNGSNTLYDHGDLRIIGNDQPQYKFGISAGLMIKGWDFSMLWSGTAKRDFWFIPSSNVYYGFTSTSHADIFNHHLDYFRDVPGTVYQGLKSGDANINTDGYWPKPYLNIDENFKNRHPSTRYLADASFVRLQNIQLGYNLTDKRLLNTNISKLRIYFSGDNLLTFTKLPPGIDPVALTGYRDQAGKTYGADKIFSMGISVTF